MFRSGMMGRLMIVYTTEMPQLKKMHNESFKYVGGTDVLKMEEIGIYTT
jgi:hypothetical protein